MSEVAELIERLRAGVVLLNGKDCAYDLETTEAHMAEAADTLATLSARVAELERRLDNEQQATDAFADICDELGCDRDNEAGLSAAHDLKTRADAAEARLAKAVEALTPSGETKAAYIGEFSFTVDFTNEDGEDDYMRVDVPWTTIKEIMAAISARAALNGEKP